MTTTEHVGAQCAVCQGTGWARVLRPETWFPNPKVPERWFWALGVCWNCAVGSSWPEWAAPAWKLLTGWTKQIPRHLMWLDTLSGRRQVDALSDFNKMLLLAAGWVSEAGWVAIFLQEDGVRMLHPKLLSELVARIKKAEAENAGEEPAEPGEAA